MSECKRKRYSELETKREATWIDDSNDRGPRPETRGTKFEGSTDRKWKIGLKHLSVRLGQDWRGVKKGIRKRAEEPRCQKKYVTFAIMASEFSTGRFKRRARSVGAVSAKVYVRMRMGAPRSSDVDFAGAGAAAPFAVVEEDVEGLVHCGFAFPALRVTFLAFCSDDRSTSANVTPEAMHLASAK